MRQLVLTITIAALAVLGAAGQAAARPKLAVLGIEPVDYGDTASVERTALVARWFTEGLRQRAAVARASYDIAPNSQRELAEVKLLSNCLDEGRECMAAIGRELGADRLLYGRIEKKRDGYSVTLRLMNVQTRSFEKQKTDLLPWSMADEDGTRRAAAEFFAALTGLAVEGTILVATNARTGRVLVDGEPRAEIADFGASVKGLGEGTLEIAIEAEGFERWVGQAEVKAGQVHRMDVTLTAVGGAFMPPPRRKRDTADRPEDTYKVLAWTSAVVTAGGITAFAITGVKVWNLEDEKREAIQSSWGNADPNERIGEGGCAEAADKGYKPVDDLCRRGKQMATLTNVLIGVSATMALATGYFAYKGYGGTAESSRPSSTRAGSRQKAPTRVLVTPEIYPTGGGVGAIIQF
jgi:hypothetical protein